MSPGRWQILSAVGLLATSILAGCQTTGPEAAISPANAAANLPPNYRDVIAQRVRQDFFDPYSIRDAAISQPLDRTSFTGPVATVCVRANAKNRMGGYAGQKFTTYVFKAGQITLTDQEYAAAGCANAVFEPFSEIEGAGQAQAPPPAGRPRT